jgi:hypothetical protein
MRGVILALGILVICAAVSYSFEDLAGYASYIFNDEQGYTAIQVTGTSFTQDPVTGDEITTVEQGTPISILIKPGEKGAKKTLSVHAYPSNLRKGTTNWCNSAIGTCLSGTCTDSFKCIGTRSLNYRTNSLSPGTYYIRIYDYEFEGYITSDPFMVIERASFFS